MCINDYSGYSWLHENPVTNQSNINIPFRRTKTFKDNLMLFISVSTRLYSVGVPNSRQNTNFWSNNPKVVRIAWQHIHIFIHHPYAECYQKWKVDFDGCFNQTWGFCQAGGSGLRSAESGHRETQQRAECGLKKLRLWWKHSSSCPVSWTVRLITHWHLTPAEQETVLGCLCHCSIKC